MRLIGMFSRGLIGASVVIALVGCGSAVLKNGAGGNGGGNSAGTDGHGGGSGSGNAGTGSGGAAGAAGHEAGGMAGGASAGNGGAGQLQLGQTCTAGTQCLTGSCVDSVCCNVTCGGTCQYCGGIPASNTPAGTCGNVTGTPKHGSCAGTGTCQGSCNGAQSTCAMPGSSVMCGSPSCNTTTEMSTAASFCDGNGNCPAGTTGACNPFLCGGTACLTACSGSGANQCATGAACIGGICQTCSTGLTACGNICANETSDPTHCGSCTTACTGTTPLCVNKKCVQCSSLSDCHAGYFACTSNTCVCRQRSANNLVPNGGFDTNVNGWTSAENMATWSGTDADACPASGSITAPDGDTLAYCVQNVLPNTTYDFGFRYLQDQGGAIYCVVTWASDTACQVLPAGRFFVQSGANPTGTSWSSIAGAGTSPAGIISAQVLCEVAGNVNIDQVYMNTVISGF